MTAWAADRGFGCPHGCGLCCQGYLPDCLPVEAEYLAHYLLSEKPAVAAAMLEPGGGAPPTRCPLYDPASPFHCSVYAARPLVCRVFGFAGTQTRDGGWAFRLCRHMPAPIAWGEVREVTHSSGLDAPLLMSDAASRAQGLRPADAGRRAPLPEALREALQRLLLRRALAGGGNGSDGGGNGSDGGVGGAPGA